MKMTYLWLTVSSFWGIKTNFPDLWLLSCGFTWIYKWDKFGFLSFIRVMINNLILLFRNVNIIT